MNDVDPLAYLTDVLTKLVDGWPMSRIDELMPWTAASSLQPNVACGTAYDLPQCARSGPLDRPDCRSGRGSDAN